MSEAQINEGAREIASLLDKGDADAVRDRLISDYLNMKPGEFNSLLKSVDNRETNKLGLDLELTDNDKDGKLEATITKPGGYLGETTRGVGWLGNAEKVVGTKKENLRGGHRVAKEHARVSAEEALQGGPKEKYPEQGQRKKK